MLTVPVQPPAPLGPVTEKRNDDKKNTFLQLRRYLWEIFTGHLHRKGAKTHHFRSHSRSVRASRSINMPVQQKQRSNMATLFVATVSILIAFFVATVVCSSTKPVVLLTIDNFVDETKETDILVQFYAPWAERTDGKTWETNQRLHHLNPEDMGQDRGRA